MKRAHAELVEKLQHYQPSQYARELVASTPILLLVGISGAGKDTVRQRLHAERQDYHHIVSHTTRAPRSNNGVMEQDGVDYHFIDWDTAAVMVERRAFVEAKVYAENIYGTSVAEIEMAKAEGRIATTTLEVQGVEEYKRISSTVKAVFLLPPSYVVWQERYRKRYGGELSSHSEDIRRRMQRALIELNLALTDGFFAFIVNDHLDDTLEAVDNLAHGKKIDDQDAAKQLVHQLIAEFSQEVGR